MSVPVVLFFVCALLAIVGAVALILAREPIHSALALILVMISLSVLYLLLGAPFIAAVQIIVYAGAIMVLFVFVIMLLNAGEEERTAGSRVAKRLGFPAVVLLAGLLAWTLLTRNQHPAPVELSGRFVGSPVAIAQLIFRDFLLPFEVTSVLILVAIMGAVVLASPAGTTAGPGSPEQPPAKREE